MATIDRTESGKWRVQIRRRGLSKSKTFSRKGDATAWARDVERKIDLGQTVSRGGPKHLRTVGDLIDAHIADMAEVGKPLRRSKGYSLDLLKNRLGRLPYHEVSRQSVIDFGRKRHKEGAGPVTVGMDVSYLRTILVHAAAVQGVKVSTEEIDLARVALGRLGLIGKANERDRRPTEDEIADLLAYFDSWKRLTMPMSRIVRFAIASAMRQSEIARIEWDDVDTRRRIVKVKDRKDPRKKDGNHQDVPMVDLTGYDAWDILQEQRRATNYTGRIFPYNPKSVGTAFRRACKELEIEDLRFHDLRHEATSRLFEAGLTIERVALVTGHKDWKMLKRYTHLAPDMVFHSPTRAA